MSDVTPEKVREWLADAGVWTGEPFDASVTGRGIARAYLEAVERAERAETQVKAVRADAWDEGHREATRYERNLNAFYASREFGYNPVMPEAAANPYRANAGQETAEPATVNPCQDVK